MLAALIELADDATAEEKAAALKTRLVEGILGAANPEEATGDLARLLLWRLPPELRAALEREPSSARRLLAQLMPFRTGENDEFVGTLVRHLLKLMGRT